MKRSGWNYYVLLTLLAPKAEPGERVVDTLFEKAMLLSGFTAGRYQVSWKSYSRIFPGGREEKLAGEPEECEKFVFSVLRSYCETNRHQKCGSARRVPLPHHEPSAALDA